MKLEKINFFRSKLAFSVPTREGHLLTINDLEQNAGAMRAVFKVNYCIVISICRIAVELREGFVFGGGRPAAIPPEDVSLWRGSLRPAYSLGGSQPRVFGQNN